MTNREDRWDSRSLVRRAAASALLSVDEEIALARRARQGDQAAADTLVTSHARLVLRITREFATYGVPVDDLVSEGLVGLVEAVRHFDPERGVRLSTYAAFWIRAYARKFTLANRRIVKAPATRHARRLIGNLRRVQRELQQTSGEAAPNAELARLLGVSEAEVEEIETVLSARDVACSKLEDATSPDLRDDRPSPEADVAESQEREQLSAAIWSAFRLLSEREQRVIRGRMLCDQPVTLACMGDALGVSRERARQIETDAKGKLRRALQAPALRRLENILASTGTVAA